MSSSKYVYNLGLIYIPHFSLWHNRDTDNGEFWSKIAIFLENFEWF
jgi:hypothetical protein